MMKKPTRSPQGIIKIALLIPAILFSLGFATGMTPQQQKTISGTVILADCGDPAIGAAVVLTNPTNGEIARLNSSTGTVVDQDGTFEIKVEGNPELVISFVGYATLRVKASEAGKKPLKLEVESHLVDLRDVPAGNSQTASNNSAENTEQDETDVLRVDEEVFYIVEEMPMYPGGLGALKSYIYSNLEYPLKLREEGISGEVQVQFMVTGKGNLKDIGVAKSSNKAFEKAALKVFEEMPDWNPGRQRGNPVNVRVIVPVQFAAGKG